MDNVRTVQAYARFPIFVLSYCQHKKELSMKLQIILEPSDEGGYTAYVPSLPGCISEGDTAEEAMANIREAIELYLEPVEDDWVPEEGTLVQELAL
jgi:predicted RNase H-like HicB family nuclease